MALGIYISVPFCKSKCSYCNFASGVFARDKMQGYVDQLCRDIANAKAIAEWARGKFDPVVDSVYLGGGTPTLLAPQQLQQIFDSLRNRFDVARAAETTAECAPGTLHPKMLAAMLRCGVNRVSLGVQSFIDEEARAVGRLHTRSVIEQDIARLEKSGIENINVDLIAGLPHQTLESWRQSLLAAIAGGVPHVSLYMLEVDQDSRLGNELLAGGARYHAHFVPQEDLIADLYAEGCEKLLAAGISQYEISNFARPGAESKHNLKYWTRQPYLGFGVDAHSMLRSMPRSAVSAGSESEDKNKYKNIDAIRLAMPETLESFAARDEKAPMARFECTSVSNAQAWEETFFLGLRLNHGVILQDVEREFGTELTGRARLIGRELTELGLAQMNEDTLRLTARGRLLSNEVFQRFIGAEVSC